MKLTQDETYEFERSDLKIDTDIDFECSEKGVTVYIETWFDVDHKFKTETYTTDDTVNFYVTYNPMDKILEEKTIIVNHIDRDSDEFDVTECITPSDESLIIEMIEEMYSSKYRTAIKKDWIKWVKERDAENYSYQVTALDAWEVSIKDHAFSGNNPEELKIKAKEANKNCIAKWELKKVHPYDKAFDEHIEFFR